MFAVWMLFALAAPQWCGAVPALMNYQGFLTDNNSAPLTGSYPMTFRLYPDSTAGAVLWTENYGSVSVTAGVFNVILGSATPLPVEVFSGSKLWLLTTVNGDDILPRRPIVTVAYAFRAGVADSTTPTTGRVVGQVQLNCGGDASGLLVYVPGRSFVCYTASSGTFDLGAVPPGTYTVHVDAGGAGAMDVTNVSVTAGGTTHMGVVTLGPNTQTDPQNCGSCGHACGTANGTSSCVAGTCQVTCNAGYADCNASPADGCETNLATNPAHCGACNAVCAVPHATTACVSGTCQIASCDAGYADCNVNAADGCEVNTATNANHCGGCGNVCNSANGTAWCVAGGCQIACNAGYGNCNGSGADGCETNLATSVMHCGACGNACSLVAAVPSCNGGACAIAWCYDGYGDCNAFAADGCETDLLSDSANCGACGNVCGPGTACENGSCW